MSLDRVCRMSSKNSAVERAPPSEERVGGDANEYQITSIDGFFNRKRGRPPKNRFVEVYKNAQQTPQAIFTSFKLNREADHTGRKAEEAHGASAASPPLISCSVRIRHSKKVLDRSGGKKAQRSQRRMRHYLATETEKCSPHSEPFDDELFIRKRNKPMESQTLPTFGSAKISSKQSAPNSCASVVRATGTFYPENFCTQTEDMPKAISVHSSEPIRKAVASDRDYEEAIDLRISTQKTKASRLPEDVVSSLREQSNNSITFPIQHLKQFFQLFQIQHDFQRNNNALLPVRSEQIFNEFKETALNIDRDITTSPAKADTIGYFKFDHGENCGFIACSYKQSAAHFHCKRKDCYYSCSDKSLSMNHLAGHQRLDSLM